MKAIYNFWHFTVFIELNSSLIDFTDIVPQAQEQVKWWEESLFLHQYQVVQVIV